MTTVRPAIVRRWTPEEDAVLLQLLEEGKTWPVIAAQLRRTMAACEKRAGFLRARTAKATTDL
jgi:Myb-like DNA-binding domain